MDKAMLEGMISTLTELGDDAQAMMEQIAGEGIEEKDYQAAFAELASNVAILSRTLVIYVTANEAAKVLLADEV